MTLPDPDGAGSLTSPEFEYAYDAMGNLTKVTDPLDNETTYDFRRPLSGYQDHLSGS